MSEHLPDPILESIPIGEGQVAARCTCGELVFSTFGDSASGEWTHEPEGIRLAELADHAPRARCPKCHFGHIQTNYHAARGWITLQDTSGPKEPCCGLASDLANALVLFAPVGGESVSLPTLVRRVSQHLWRICPNCGMNWPERPVDLDVFGGEAEHWDSVPVSLLGFTLGLGKFLVLTHDQCKETAGTFDGFPTPLADLVGAAESHTCP